MKKREANIKQHYVPQFYLRNFTDSKGKIVVYDSIRDNKYITTPAKECYSNYFYDLDLTIFEKFVYSEQNYEELVDDKIRTLNEEVSAISINFLNEIKNCDTNFSFSGEQRDKLYNFIVLQILRTPFYRNRLNYLNVPFCIKAGLSAELGDEKTQDLINNLLIYGVISRMYNEDFKLNKLYYIIFEHLIDEILDLKRQLEKSGKLFLVNKSGKEFVCSSSPINALWKPNPFAHTKALVTTFDSEQKLFDIGEYLEFLTIHLPISSDIAIFIFDKTYSKPLTVMNQGIGIIQNWNSDLITNLNLSTMLKNGDKIFSANGEYDEIIAMKNSRKNPLLNFRFDESKR